MLENSIYQTISSVASFLAEKWTSLLLSILYLYDNLQGTWFLNIDQVIIPREALVFHLTGPNIL